MRPGTGQPGAEGFTLIEVSAASVVVAVGLMALGGVMVSTGHQGEQARERRMVLSQARILLERIQGTTPGSIASTYNNLTSAVSGVDQISVSVPVLSVSVNSSVPKLLVVTITGNWSVGGHNESLTLRTEVYNPSG